MVMDRHDVDVAMPKYPQHALKFLLGDGEVTVHHGVVASTRKVAFTALPSSSSLPCPAMCMKFTAILRRGTNLGSIVSPEPPRLAGLRQCQPSLTTCLCIPDVLRGRAIAWESPSDSLRWPRWPSQLAPSAPVCAHRNCP